MSYLVLARKYRPRSFTEMVGQEHVVQALGNALEQRRLHHAYLFTGTRGVGKTTVARILAKSLNCTGPDGQGEITAQPCGVCPACRDIDSGRYVDYVELDAASNRGVEEISQLLDQAVYKPVVGRFKVYLIDEVHMLSTTAFNAMLKTLEEPPEYLKFVLATTDPQKVPATVLSRCLQFNLRPMAPQTVAEHLAHVLQAEAIAAEPGALRLLARAAQGSMRDALSLTDQAIAFGGGVLQEAGVRQMLGAVDRSHVVRIVEALAAADGRALVAEADALRAQGLSAAGTLEELAQVAQQMALLQAVPEAADADDPDTPQLQRLAALLPADETQLLYSLTLHGRTELGLAPDEHGALLMVLLRLLAFRPQGGPGRGVAAPVASTSPAIAATPTTHRPAAPQVLAPARPALSAAAPPPAAVAAPAAVRPVAAPVVQSNPPAPAVAAPAPALGSALTPPASPAAAPLRAVAPAPKALTRPALLNRPLRAAPAEPAAAPAPALRRVPVAPVDAAPPAGRPSSRPAALEEPPWMAEEPPLEDLPDAGATASRAPWEDESAAPARPAAAQPARPMPVTRGHAPLLAPTAAAQTRYVPQPPRELPPEAARASVSAAAVMPLRVAAPPVEPDQDASASEPAADEEPPEEPLTSRWLTLLQPLLERQALSGFARELAWQAQCIAWDAAAQPQRLLLRVERESLRQGTHRERLQTVLAETLGGALQLDVETGPVSDSAARRDAAAKARAQRQAEALMRDDPLVQRLLARFPGARLVPGSIRPLG